MSPSAIESFLCSSEEEDAEKVEPPTSARVDLKRESANVAQLRDAKMRLNQKKMMRIKLSTQKTLLTQILGVAQLITSH